MFRSGKIMESAATKLFRKSDTENKGFIVKRDMQRMKEDTALSPEQLEIVFDTLDGEKNGFLTLEQFLNGFREYLILTTSDVAPTATSVHYEDDTIKIDYNDALNDTLSLIKGTNILKTSAEELRYINEQMKDRSNCQLSQWQLFLKDLHHDLQTYRESHLKLEKLMKQKEDQHQTYVRKMFEEIEFQLKEEKEKEEYNEQMQRRIKAEMKVLRSELLVKDELLQQFATECRELKKQLQKLQKQKEKAMSLNSTLLSKQNYYETELEEERLKRIQIQSKLETAKRRFSIEKKQCFKDGFELAKRVVHIQEQGLLQQLHVLENMQQVLGNKNHDKT